MEEAATRSLPPLRRHLLTPPETPRGHSRLTRRAVNSRLTRCAVTPSGRATRPRPPKRHRGSRVSFVVAPPWHRFSLRWFVDSEAASLAPRAPAGATSLHWREVDVHLVLGARDALDLEVGRKVT